MSMGFTGNSWSAQRATATTWWATVWGTASLLICPFLAKKTLRSSEAIAGRRNLDLCMWFQKVVMQTLSMRTTFRDGSSLVRMNLKNVWAEACIDSQISTTALKRRLRNPLARLWSEYLKVSWSNSTLKSFNSKLCLYSCFKDKQNMFSHERVNESDEWMPHMASTITTSIIQI